MDGLRIVLLGVGVIILLINFFINSANIIRITSYCFRTNTLGMYWEMFFKNSINARAIISTVIGFVIALIVFFIIAPIILIKSAISNPSNTVRLDKDLLFKYYDKDLEDKNLSFYSNLSIQTGLDKIEIKITGKIRIDAIMLISKIDEQCKIKNKSFEYKVMHNIKLADNKEVTLPLLVTIDGKKFPIYFLYTKLHQEQYQKAKNTLFQYGYNKCVYFSSEQISQH